MRVLRPDPEANGVGPSPPDPLGLVLTWGLALTLALAPLPFGAVRPGGRLALEIAAFVLLAVWGARALARPAAIPSRPAAAALIGLLALGLAQSLPLGDEARGPREAPAAAAREAEGLLLGEDPARFDLPRALSVDPPATASALRTGAALAALLLVAATVAAARGPRAIALALAAGGAFQAIYGLAVLATGHDRIWDEPKRAYLDAATGTFVNKNHFAAYLAAACAAGLGLALAAAIDASRARARGTLQRLFERDGVRAMLLGLLTLLVLAGMLLSQSRGGITVGLAACALLLFVGTGGALSRRTRVAACVIGAALAAIPVARLGLDELAGRYARSAEEIQAPGGRPTIWADALGIAAAHPITGAGFGTFAAVYPSFRSPEVRARYSHAHNDLVQLIAEGGAIGLALLVLLAVPVARAALPALTGAHGPVWAGLAGALVAIAAHALVDFPFHIPAVAAVAAALAGALCGAPWSARS